MKRVLPQPTPGVSWLDIPRDVSDQIVLSLYGQSAQIVLVSKEWWHLVEQHQKWFERAKDLYSPLKTITSRGKETWFKRLSELDKEADWNRYEVYGGQGRSNYETIITDAWIWRPDYKAESPCFSVEEIYHEIQLALCYLEEYMPQDESARLKNYIGRLLVAKFGKLVYSGCLLKTDIPTLYPLLAYIKNETSSILTRRNFHPRDLHISFKEEGHQYTLTFWCQEKGKHISIKSTKSSENEDDNGPLNIPIGKGEKMSPEIRDFYYWLLSGTGFIGSLFPPFDAREAARNRHDRTKSDEEIMLEWKEIGRVASEEGTKMHLNWENDALDKPVDMTNASTGIYLEYKAKIVNGKMRPYVAEWKIWDLELMICGSVDILYEEWPPRKCPGRDPNKKYLILGDYKRSKEIKLFNPYQSGIPECSAVANAGDCNYMHYMIQLNLYKYILEKNYDVVILRTFIIVLHPDQDHFIKMDLNPPPGFMDSILDYRRKTLAEHRVAFSHVPT